VRFVAETNKNLALYSDLYLVSVERLARVERSGDRITVEGEIFRTRPDQPWGPYSLLYNGYRVSFQGVKRSGRDVDHPPHLESRLKKE
jgi:hypothetical protein